jgi:predicted N-acetyltransferase YhbS
MTIQYRYYQPADADGTNRLAHEVFGIAPFSAEIWQQMEEKHHVTVVAEDTGRIVGAIPYDLRDFLIRPGVSLRAAFAHMVCVDEAYRNQGVGSGMMRFAKANLPDLCEAMFVYTGSEGVAPYTFYQKNGFIDLHYCRFFNLDLPQELAVSGITVQPFNPQEFGEEALHRCYQSAYRGYAGFPIHELGYWQEAIDSIIFAEIPTQFFIAFQKQGDKLTGYAIFGYSSDGCILLELAAQPGRKALLGDLLRAAVNHASAKGEKRIRMLSSAHHPVQPVLYQLGFQPDPREEAAVTAAVIFQHASIWRKLACGQPPFALKIWTPTQTLELLGTGRTIHLEMKDDLLTRLFLSRENFLQAWEAEKITSPDAQIPLEALASLFAPAPWVFHWLEWI